MTVKAPARNERVADAPVDRLFLDRWSPRAFSPEPIAGETLRTLFEAARWAPSCFNEQPWVFIYSGTEEDRLRILDVLTERNQVWAKNAPVLALLFARRTFRKTGRPNRWAAFDCGAAWMSLTVQARFLGLYTHAMAGYRRDRAYQAAGIPEEEYEVICAIAIGKYGDPEDLPGEIRASEFPKDRKPLAEVAVAGQWPEGRV